LAITLCAVMTAGESFAAEINWETIPGQAQAAAMQSNKPLLVYVGASYCGYCKKLEQTTWSNRGVARMVETNFVPLKLDSQRNADIARQLRVRAFPTVIVLSPDGHLLARNDGYVDARAMASFLTRSTRDAATRTSYKR